MRLLNAALLKCLNIFAKTRISDETRFLIKYIVAVREGDYIVSYAALYTVCSRAFQNSNRTRARIRDDFLVCYSREGKKRMRRYRSGILEKMFNIDI